MKKQHEKSFPAVFESYRIHSVIKFIFFRSESLAICSPLDFRIQRCYEYQVYF